ncbi:hypothetical protein LCGC14_2580620 [marine sediment metagenome]|uniref:Uncharacterized protein n=1 Tax=marine sediment metagenome TaxID=412755 RepID=A0A0F9B2F3_9ZZZZ
MVWMWLSGFGIGFGVAWIVSYYFVVRPLINTQRDMRYQGFVHDRAPTKLKLEPEVKKLMRNET